METGAGGVLARHVPDKMILLLLLILTLRKPFQLRVRRLQRRWPQRCSEFISIWQLVEK
jgi:hypothetical protein